MMGAEKVIRRMLVVGVSLAVLLAGILVFLTGVVTRLIVVPVLQLIRASEQVGRGDFAPALPPMVDNEFGVLSRSFSQMTTALRREREEIASLNRFSEAVTQCTSEIEVYDLLLHSLERAVPAAASHHLQIKPGGELSGGGGYPRAASQGGGSLAGDRRTAQLQSGAHRDAPSW